MTEEFEKIHLLLKKHCPGGSVNSLQIYPGIGLFYWSLAASSFPVHHKALENMVQINYCKAGQLLWKMKNGNQVYLNPGDFSLHTMDVCADSSITFPSGQYRGLIICVNLQTVSRKPPELLKDIFPDKIKEKFCQPGTPVFLAGNEQTESIFNGFYDQPESLALPYQKLKTLELLLYTAKTDAGPGSRLTEYQAGQVKAIHEIHEMLLQHIDRRMTIDELSRQYLINPTTLKETFKSVYGTSIAAHMKEHRMAHAARMLRESDLSIAEIAQSVGYDSQSRFTSAFKAAFQVLPKEYRKFSQVPGRIL